MKTNANSKSGLFNLRVAIILCVCLIGACLSMFARSPKIVPKSLAGKQSVTLTSQAAGTATFNGIGFLPGDNSSQVRAVTADGSVAVGASGFVTSNINTTGRVGVEWTASGGLVALPSIPSDGTHQAGTPFITASDITASGSWIAYRARPGGAGRREAVITNSDFSQVIPLGRLGANVGSSANQISDDGSIVFGFADNLEAFRWTQATGMQQIAEPPLADPVNQYHDTVPAGRACSTSGNVSVGQMGTYDANTDAELDIQAYFWTGSSASTQLQLLGYLPGGTRSAAEAVSADGSTVFGVSSSSNVPATFDANGNWNYNGELFLWTTTSQTMTALGVPAGYDSFENLAGMSADGALLATVAADSTGHNPDSFFVVKTATKEAFDAHDLLVAAGAGPAISGWSEFSPLGISDNGDTLFGAATDPNALIQGWVANFPVGYLRNVQTFTASDPNSDVNVPSGDFIGRDGNYSANNLTIGATSGGVSRRFKTAAASITSGSLTLSGTATLSVAGNLSLFSGSVLNVIGAATVTAGALDLPSGATLGVELNSAAESINRVTVSGPIDLTGFPDLDVILTYGPAAGTAFTIIHNTSGQPIQGQFNGFPQNGTVLIGQSRGLRASYSGGTNGQDFVLTVLPPPPVSSAVSRMTSSAGTFDVPLPLTGSPGIECRTSNSLGAGNYTLVITFTNNLISVGNASVTSGVGSVSSRTMGPDANQYTVNLTGVQNAQQVTVTLTSAIDVQNNAGDVLVPMGVLIGDTNADTFVDAIDTAQTKSQSGHTVTNSNFREDVNVDGFIDAIDTALVKSKSGTVLSSSPSNTAASTTPKAKAR